MAFTTQIRYPLLLLALACISCSSVDNTQLSPYAAFSGGCEAIVDTIVTFTNESLSADRYEWDFGNGTISTAKHPTAIYHLAGNYTVRLICRNSSGDADTAIEQLRIVPPVTSGKMLDVTHVEPLVNGWSCPAAMEMVLLYFGRVVRQCDIQEYYYQRNCCANPESCDSYVSELVLNTNLREFGNLEGEWQYAPLTPSQIRMELAQDRPAIAILQQGTYWHTVLITGWVEGNILWIIDPYIGTYQVAYDDLLRYGQYDWVQSMYCIKKRRSD